MTVHQRKHGFVFQSSCSSAWQKVIQRRLSSYAEVINIQEDSYAGCRAVRRIQASEEVYHRQMEVLSTCRDILDGGLTKLGFISCKTNEDCYTECQNTICKPSSLSEYGMVLIRTWVSWFIRILFKLDVRIEFPILCSRSD